MGFGWEMSEGIKSVMVTEGRGERGERGEACIGL